MTPYGGTRRNLLFAEIRSQLDRLLDPENTAVTLATVSRAAHALGKRLVVKIVDTPTPKRKLAKAAAS